jgi:hypothetical protein
VSIGRHASDEINCKLWKPRKVKRHKLSTPATKTASQKSAASNRCAAPKALALDEQAVEIP